MILCRSFILGAKVVVNLRSSKSGICHTFYSSMCSNRLYNKFVVLEQTKNNSTWQYLLTGSPVATNCFENKINLGHFDCDDKTLDLQVYKTCRDHLFVEPKGLAIKYILIIFTKEQFQEMSNLPVHIIFDSINYYELYKELPRTMPRNTWSYTTNYPELYQKLPRSTTRTTHNYTKDYEEVLNPLNAKLFFAKLL